MKSILILTVWAVMTMLYANPDGKFQSKQPVDTPGIYMR